MDPHTSSPEPGTIGWVAVLVTLGIACLGFIQRQISLQARRLGAVEQDYARSLEAAVAALREEMRDALDKLRDGQREEQRHQETFRERMLIETSRGATKDDLNQLRSTVERLLSRESR